MKVLLRRKEGEKDRVRKEKVWEMEKKGGL
jgi:hypothetical protein